MFKMTQSKMKELQIHQNKLNPDGKVITLGKTKQNTNCTVLELNGN